MPIVVSSKLQQVTAPERVVAGMGDAVNDSLSLAAPNVTGRPDGQRSASRPADAIVRLRGSTRMMASDSMGAASLLSSRSIVASSCALPPLPLVRASA